MPQFNGLNYLTQNRATLQIKGLEDVEFAVTAFNLPSVSLGYTSIVTPFMDIKEANSKPEFGDMEVQFVVDENMTNWLAIFKWIHDLSFNRISNPRNTDGTIIVYNSNNNPILKFTLVGVVPSFVSEIQFNESTHETTPIIASARFSLTYFELS